MKYNSFVNPFISCKTDIINDVLYMHVYTYITMLELVIKIKLKNHGNNRLAIEIFLPRKYTE